MGTIKIKIQIKDSKNRIKGHPGNNTQAVLLQKNMVYFSRRQRSPKDSFAFYFPGGAAMHEECGVFGIWSPVKGKIPQTVYPISIPEDQGKSKFERPIAEEESDEEKCDNPMR